ncbi:MAG: glycosyltransferase, partial [bacterium]
MGIVILNWNGKNDTISCIKSIYNTQKESFDIIVVDNGSTDHSISEIKKTFPQVLTIKNKKNLGFAGGMNIGLEYCRQAGYLYILMLNNDTLMLQNNLLSAYQKVF